MTTEVLTGYTEGGSGNLAHLSETATTVTFTGMASNEIVHLSYDFGAGHFATNAYAEGTANIASRTGTTSQVFATGFSDSLGCVAPSAGCATNEAGMYVLMGATAAPKFYALKAESGAGALGTAPQALSLSTDYYYRFGLYSALGRYGGIVSQVFTDSGRTALVSSSFVALTASASHQYFMAAQSTSDGVSNTITGTNADVTLYTASLTGTDLTVATGGWAETDPSSHLVGYADCLVVTTLNTNETAYHFKDFGASYFSGNYTIKGAMNITAFASGAAGQMLNVLSLVNTLGHANSTADLHGIAVSWISATTYSLKARECTSATEYLTAASSTLTVGFPYWISINRDTAVGTYGTLYVKIYSDPLYANQIGSTVSLTLHDNGTPDNVAFQYLNAVQSYNTGSARSTTMTIGGITITTPGTNFDVISDGAATATATVSSKASAALSSDGAATATITAGNADTNTVILNSAGESTATATSATIASAALSSDGAATAEVVSNSFLVPLTSDGVATAEAVGASIAAAAASSDGVATADTISSFTLNPGIIISCRIPKWSTAGEVGATGLIPYLKFNNPTTRKSMDFGDSALTFKNNGDCISITAAMSPVDATNYPGLYYYSVDGTGLGTDAATRFDYFIDATISATETYMNEGSVIILDGVEVLPGLTAAEHTLLVRLSAAGTNKHVLNPADGTISVYDDNGALLYSGLAYSNAAGTVRYNGTAAVHHTTRLT